MQPKKFSEYEPIVEADGQEIVPLVKDGKNEVIRTRDLPISVLVQQALEDKANDSALSAVAKTGNYNDLTNKPPAVGKFFMLEDDNGVVRKYSSNLDGSLHIEVVTDGTDPGDGGGGDPVTSDLFGTAFGLFILS